MCACWWLRITSSSPATSRRGCAIAGSPTDLAHDGAAALQKGGVYRYDVVVLDRDMPAVHGDAVCVALRDGGSDARILMLTAAAAIGDRVEGLNLGADDYLPKPFAFEELVARVHALARRAPAGPPLLTWGDLTLDRARRRATRAGQELSLTRKELGVLEDAAGGRRRGGQRRGAARARVGRECRPVHAHGDGHTDAPAAQARRAGGDRDGGRRRLPHAMTPAILRRLWPRRMRSRLAVMYTVAVPARRGGAAVADVHAGGPRPRPCPRRVSPKQLSPQTQELLGLCKRAGAPGQPSMSASMLERCNRALVAAGAGAYDRREGTLKALKGASLIALGVLAIAAAGLGWLVAGRALRPVRSITEAARRASELRLGQRLALTGPDDELKQLADTFDVMLERLDAAFTSQKQFVANAAHELRTPLTAMRAAIEVTLSKPTRTPEQLEAMAARVKRSVQRAEATVEALLALATSQLGPVAHEAIDLATAAEDALDATQAAIAQREIEVDAALEPALAQGDRVLLERMIANLVENAARHNHTGGWIGVHTAQRNGAAVFEIANTGPTCRPSRSRPCSSPSPAPSSASTPPTASGSASRSPTRSLARTTPRSSARPQDRAAGSKSRSRSRRARAESQGGPPVVRAARVKYGPPRERRVHRAQGDDVGDRRPVRSVRARQRER